MLASSRWIVCRLYSSGGTCCVCGLTRYYLHLKQQREGKWGDGVLCLVVGVDPIVRPTNIGALCDFDTCFNNPLPSSCFFSSVTPPPSPVVQAKMNSYFMGSNMVLAERYASLLKTMFVCLFFSAIFPQGYFVASMAMFMTYWVRGGRERWICCRSTRFRRRRRERERDREMDR